ncbi:MAG: DUF2723 domain-containing protein [Bacteroidetes bacterium]|nr:DUF2723 domain-containing protein [Bacteroidota bacterium]MDA0888531.1 DUF2723 domain-containing protein [Bacteroidota bacterium]MDA1084174.1 DUF2723 domain-containing protein [Bacteroidota bacterium]
MNYSKGNTLTGWFVFCVALVTYYLTVEPTASYWDCSEYIATSAKLQVGHPPGAPLFQMMGAFFSSFASSPERVAFWVNMMSVLASAFTILFLFWSLTRIITKFVIKEVNPTGAQAILVLGAGVVGALSYTFSDSFWFNAVEAEVYAMAMLMTSAMFWLGLRWEEDMLKPHGDRWLVLIAFLIGLSFGVHFMGLLTVPAIGMLYYFKHYTFSWKSFVVANVVSVAVLLFIFKLLLPLTLAYFGNAEVFFVNSFGLPFNSGTIIAGLSILAFFIWGLRFTQQKKWVQANTGLWCVVFVLVGFSSWILLPIRANANTVINENAPTDARSLLAYYNLEQYPETHLFYGPMYSDMYAGQDDEDPYKDDKPKYEKDLKKGRYVVVNAWEDARINANSKHTGLLPRMWSSGNAVNYITYFGAPDFDVKPEYRGQTQLIDAINDFISRVNNGEVDANGYHKFLQQFGSYLDIEKPSLIDNLNYLFTFQINYMYFRYFMWNFAGKQNDEQGKLDPFNGNWISGISWLDSLRLGPQKNLYDDAKNNKGRNTYYMLPLFLGVLGALFLYQQDKKRFWVLLVFFLFTGLALKVYLNERVFEPRERDYALVGSFYVFAMCIGIGVVALAESIKKYVSLRVAAPLSVMLCLLAVPVLMGSQNWDDHDRSNRYTAQSTAKAYLDSIDEDKDALIFTIGDNDTFALWYAQEIEGYRTDVRSINTQLLATDWYIDQLKRKTYESTPIPSQLTHKQYAYGTRDYIKFEAIIDSVRWGLGDFVDWVASDNPRTRYKHLLQQYEVDLSQIPEGTQNLVYYPTNKVRVPVNKENVLKSGVVKPEDADLIVDFIDIDLPTSGLYKNRIMMLDILRNNDWKRPIYFTGGSYEDDEYIWMKEYLQLDGLIYKLVPIKTPENPQNPYQMGRIDSERMYNIVKKWDWGNANSPDIYHDPETRKNSISFRSNMARLAEQLVNENQAKKAIEILDLTMEKMPLEYFGYYSLLTPIAATYYRAESTQKGGQLIKQLAEKYADKLLYYDSFSPADQQIYAETILSDVERYRAVVDVAVDAKDNAIASTLIKDFIENTRQFAPLYSAYEYYTPMTSYVSVLFSADMPESGRLLYDAIAQVYQNRLALFSQVPKEELTYYKQNIAIEIRAYQTILESYQTLEPDLDHVSEANKAFRKATAPYTTD